MSHYDVVSYWLAHIILDEQPTLLLWTLRWRHKCGLECVFFLLKADQANINVIIAQRYWPLARGIHRPLIAIGVWISNHIDCYMWDVITHPLPLIWAGVCNYIPQFYVGVIAYPHPVLVWLISDSERCEPRIQCCSRLPAGSLLRAP